MKIMKPIPKPGWRYWFIVTLAAFGHGFYDIGMSDGSVFLDTILPCLLLGALYPSRFVVTGLFYVTGLYLWHLYAIDGVGLSTSYVEADADGALLCFLRLPLCLFSSGAGAFGAVLYNAMIEAIRVRISRRTQDLPF